VYGIEAYLVDVEINITTGTNGSFRIFGTARCGRSGIP
jgi:hypothetical protein